MAMLHFYCLIITLICGVSCGRECINIKEGCACKMSDSNETIGLKDLARNDSMKRVPRFVAVDTIKKGWYFAYHPCGTFDMFLEEKSHNPGYHGCKGSTAVRFTNVSVNQCDGLGNLEGSIFKVEDDYEYPVVSNITVTYRNLTENKEGAVISLICDPDVSIEKSNFVHINVTHGVNPTYYFQLTSKCACPGGCSLSDIPSGSIWLLPFNNLIQTMLMLAFFAVFGTLNI